jgi:mono/diheme cytochrome c family protein
LTGATTSKPGFVADVAGSYVATLTVSDGKVTASASVTITAPAQAPAPTPPPAIDGAALYSAKCSGCHGAIKPIFKAAAKSAQNIQNAINSNRGGMGFLSSLTAAEVQAIAAAITAANP